MKYIEESTEENAVTQELKELHDYIISIKKRKEVGVRYMKSWELEQVWRREAREEGLTEGKTKGRVQSILDLLSELGNIPEDLSERISGEKNIEILCKWVKLAARAESLSDFERKMKLTKKI